MDVVIDANLNWLYNRIEAFNTENITILSDDDANLLIEKDRAVCFFHFDTLYNIDLEKCSDLTSAIVCVYEGDIDKAFINCPNIIDYQNSNDFNEQLFQKQLFLASQFINSRSEHKNKYKRLSSILKNSHEAVVFYDEEATISFASQKVTDILGLNTPDELLGRKAYEFVYEADLKEAENLFEKLLSGSLKSLELKQRLIRNTGELIWVQAHISDERKTEGINGFISNFSIIEEEIEAKKTAFIKNQKYRFFTDKASFIVFGLDATGNINFINGYGQQQLNVNFNDIKQDETWSSYVHDKDFEVLQQEWEKAAKSLETYSVSARLKLFDNNFYMHKIIADPIFDDENKLNGWLGVCTNVNKDFLLREQLEREKNRFEQAQYISDIGDWEYHPDTGEINFSPHMYEIFDLDPNEPIPALNVFTEEYHKLDAELLTSSIENALNNGIEYDIDIRLKSPKGRHKILRCIAKRLQKHDGEYFLAGVSQDITQKINVYKSLKASENRFTEFITNAPFGAMVIDELGIIQLANPEVYDYFDSVSQIEGENIQTAFDVENSVKIDKSLKRVLETNSTDDCILKIPSDHYFNYFSASFFPLGKGESDLNLIGCLLEDITQRYLQEEELLKSEERLYVTQSIAKIGDWYFDIATQEVEWSPMLFEIFEKDISKGKIQFEDVFEYYFEEDIPILKEHVEQCLHSGVPYELSISLKKPEKKIIRATGIPVYNSKNKIIALRGTVQDITESVGKDILLKESERRYKLASKATSDAVWEYDLRTGQVIWGEGLKNIFGYPEKELSSNIVAWQERIHPKDKERVTKSIDAAVASKKNYWHANYRHRNYSGKYAYVSDRGYIVRDENGTPVKLVGAMQDITEKKEREEHLKLLESVITSTKDSILITESEPIEKHKNGPKIIYANKAFCEMTGYSAEEIIGQTPRILQGPETDLNELAKLKKAMLNWESYSVEVINYKKDGTKFWNNFQIDPVKNENGWYTHWISVQRDTTERKTAEEKLKETLIRYDLATISKDIGIWEYDFKTKTMFWDDSMYDIYELKSSDYKNANGLWERYTHPEDFPETELTAQDSIEKGYLLQSKFRIITPGNKIKHIQVSGIVQKDEEGAPIRYVGINRDVTEYYESRIRLENAKKEQEDILTSITEGFFAIDKDFTVTYWNKAASEIMQKSAEEIVGKNLWEEFPDAINSKFYTTYHKAIDNQKVLSILEYYAPNDQWLEATAYPKENGLTIFFNDVTERMRYTRALEKQNEQLKKIAWSHSHELRSPLARIITLVDYIRNYNDNSIKLSELLGYIKVSAEELDEVIHKIVRNTEEVKLAEEDLKDLD